jgi:hypothetical protein
MKIFRISKNGGKWHHLQGEVPYEGCIKYLGDRLDQQL